MVMTLYFLLERDHIHRYAEFIFQSGDKAERSKKMFTHIEVALGSWVRGEALLMFTIGLMTFFGLTLMGIPYAIPLAIVAGLLEALPNLGPTIAAVPAVIVSLISISPITALFTALLYWAIQALENNFIVPFVMKRTVGINPLTSIVLILIGFRFGGVIGALLVVPYYIVVRVVLKEFAPEIERIFR
jgi:predicted PurR-regulated permease PerM